MEQSGEEGDTSGFMTPQKMKATFKRRNRESILSPSSMRAGKAVRVKDDVMIEKIQMMIKSDLSFMRDDIRKEMYANADSYKNSMYADMRKELDKAMLDKHNGMYTSLKVEMQNLIRTEVNIMECTMQEKLDGAIANFESWKTNMENRIKEKDTVIKELKEELVACKIMPKIEGENQPFMLKELEEIREQMKNLREGEEQKSKVASSWAERLFKTQEKVDEAEKWIEDAKKEKAQAPEAVQTFALINMTIEEEQKRRNRALHVRITGIKDTGNIEEEVKELLQNMGIPEPTHTSAWRVGKKGIDEKGNVKEKALILRFPTMESRKEFLKKRPALKKTGIFMGDDLTLAQVAHMRELMPEIKAAREKGKIAFYSGGKVVILERRTS